MNDRRVLLVEDEMLVAMTLEDMLIELGYRIAGIATNLETAVESARNLEFDLAFLDINLNGHYSLPVAEILQQRCIPFIFQTGYGAQGVDIGGFHAAVVTKPFTAADIERAIEAAVKLYTSPK